MKLISEDPKLILMTQDIHTHYTVGYSRLLMGASKDFSNSRIGRDIAGFVDTLKNPREGEDSSISDSNGIYVSEWEYYKNASTFGCNPHIAEEGALRHKIFLFQDSLRKSLENGSEIWKGI